MRKFLAFAALLVIGCGGGDAPRLMVKSGPEPAGTNCTNSGVIIQTGYDDNDNGVLMPARSLIHSMCVMARWFPGARWGPGAKGRCR